MKKAQALLAAIAVVAPGALDALLPKPRPPRIFTSADKERIAKAEAKRQRKAARRLAQIPSTSQGTRP